MSACGTLCPWHVRCKVNSSAEATASHMSILCNGSGTPHHGALQNSPRRKPRRKAEQNTHDYSQQGRQPQQLRTHNRHTTSARPAPTIPASQLGRQPQQPATRQKDNNTTNLDSPRPTSTVPPQQHQRRDPPRQNHYLHDSPRPTSTQIDSTTSTAPERLTLTIPVPARLTSTYLDHFRQYHRDSPRLTLPHLGSSTS